MDIERFVENIKFYCNKKGVKPTVACAESGAGKNMLNHLSNRGSIPSVEKVHRLAKYLGVSVSELIGEKEIGSNPQTSADLSQEEWDIIAAYRRADGRAQQVVDLTLEPFRTEQQKRNIIG